MSLFGKFKEASSQKTGLSSSSSSLLDPISPPIQPLSSKETSFSYKPKTITSLSFLRLREDPHDFPFKYSLALSGSIHVLSPVLIPLLWALLVFLLAALLNINLDLAQLFPPPEPRTQDMEFVLVPDKKAEEPKDARFLGEFNQEAGGQPETDRPEPLEKPEQSASNTQAAPEVQANKSPAPSPKPTPQVNPSPKQQAVKPQPQQPPTPQPKAPPMPTHKVAIATPKTPTFQPNPTQKPTPETPQAASNPAPMIQKTTGPRTPASKAAQKLASISQAGLAHANRGSAQKGKAKKPGVSVRQADYGPYMAEVKRRMSRNWRPPRGERDKRVELKFEINRDGSLGTIQVSRSSGETLADKAAINAVKISAPFKTLPPFHKGKSVQILFTFDYNVLGGTY